MAIYTIYKGVLAFVSNGPIEAERGNTKKLGTVPQDGQISAFSLPEGL